MSEIKVGDEVITCKPLWHLGEDVGNRLGKVISTSSYILVEIYQYHSNPVKCFKNEVELVPKTTEDMANDWLDDLEFEDDDYIDQLFKNFKIP